MIESTTTVQLMREDGRWRVHFLGDDALSIAIRRHFDGESFTINDGFSEYEARQWLGSLGVVVSAAIVR